MLGNVKRYSRIYLAYGYTDLRYGIDGLARLYRIIFHWTHFKKAVFFCSVAGGQTASKGSYGKAMVSCLFIKDWKRGTSSGQGRRQKPVRSRRNSSHG